MKPVPHDWLGWPNRAEREAELQALRRSVNRSCPYGNEQWVERVAAKLGRVDHSGMRLASKGKTGQLDEHTQEK